MAKVLLVQPNRDIRLNSEDKYAIPSTLIVVATAIEEKHTVKIYDRNIKKGDQEFFQFLKEYDPDIIGFTAMTSAMLLDIIHLGPLIKKENEKRIIVVGGVHVTIEPDSVLNEKYVDYIIRGEGDEAFLEFCDIFDKNPKNLGKLKNVNMNALRPLVDMNKLKFPDYSLINLKEYGQVFLMTTRGCPGNCTFCYNAKMWGKEGHPFVRIYDTEKTKEFLKEAIEKYGITDFTIGDENFTTLKTRAIEICKFLKEKYDKKINFFVFSRADFVNDEMLNALKMAGCSGVQFGSESGSQRVLDFLDKHISVEVQGKAFELCRKNRIFSDASFMVGIPTETVEEANMTEKFIKKYKPDLADVKIFNPMPGSKIFEDLVKERIITKPKTLEEWADWSGDWSTIRHNCSKIPDDLLLKIANRLWNYRYYSTRIRKALYWIKRGKFENVIQKTKNLIIRRYSSRTY
jgi:radical SAM superfamily enzyme YgiQ (UPF0313 family)